MIEDPVPVLTALLNAEIPTDGNRFTLDGRTVYAMDDELSTHIAVSEDFFLGDRREAQKRVENDFVQQFRAIVDAIQSTWGPPDLQQYPVDSFPYTEEEPKSFVEDMYWRGAVAFAYWRRVPDQTFAFVCIEHQDAELPYCLLLGVKRNCTYVA